tara:strand:+ start:119 stop:301 length:183 start_codon:yes stop_codon:yes gene_type:complete
MNEQQQLTNSYAESLITVAKTIKINNESGKEVIILNLVKQMNNATKNMIKMLEVDEQNMA